ncbi:copper chaperone CopZ [Alkalihalobacillus sp. AL-G]|uniref:copper chaperone CopZ n=1 Tax=Alkalihalobacillus sp. AL-G TaxID=2926399 RepID=UPI00272C3828|nr:copper chaperone CopZ [Alkalihalobacillus sp. AL-G]WLD92016.1 copper chaperone CopZ [Alkalihalobacillus sp. AL-G]
MTDKTLNVQGMSCGHCVSSIEGSVSRLKGIETVKVHLEDGKVNVRFDSDKVSIKEITETIEDQGYDIA